MFVLHMRNEENRIESEDENKEGIRKSELVAWYLDQSQDQIDSEEELLEAKALAEKVIDRLIYVVRIERSSSYFSVFLLFLFIIYFLCCAYRTK